MKNSTYGWIIIALLWVVAALNYIDRQVIFALFPLLRTQLHLSDIQLGFLGTAFLWIYGIFSPIGGYLADRLNRRSVILFSISVWSIVTLLIGLSRHYPQLVVAQALLGISEAFYLPAALALVADYHTTSTRSRAIGLHQSGLYAGVALGGWGGGWVGEHYGWHEVFYILGVFGIVYSVFLSIALKNSPPEVGEKPRVHLKPPVAVAIHELSRRGAFWLLAIANCCSAVAFWSVYAWMALFLYDRFKISVSKAGFSSTFYIQVASFAGIFLGGWLADKWARTNRRGRVLVQVIGFGFAGPGLLIVGTTTSWQTSLACLLLFGLGRGFFDCNLMPVLCQIIPDELRASGYGILNATSCIAGGVMATAAGLLKDRMGLGHALQFSALFLVFSAVLLASLRVRNGRESAEEKLVQPVLSESHSNSDN